MAFHERFKGKTEVVGRDGHAQQAPPPPAAAAPAPAMSGKAKSMPMPMPMPMPLGQPAPGTPPQAQQPQHAAPAAAPPAKAAPVAAAGGKGKSHSPTKAAAGKRRTGGGPSPSAAAAGGRAAPPQQQQQPEAAPAAGAPMPMPMPMPVPGRAPQQQQVATAAPPSGSPVAAQPSAAGSKPAGAAANVPRAGRRAPSKTRASPPPAQTGNPRPAAAPQQATQAYQMPATFALPQQQQPGMMGMGAGMQMPPPPGMDMHPGQMPIGGAGLPPAMGMPPGPHHDAASAEMPVSPDAAERQKRKSALDKAPAPLKTGEQPTYTPYDIDSFNRINKPVRLGGLGPSDSDETRAARERRKQALEYANNNNRVNLVVMAATEDSTQPKKAPAGPQPSKQQQELAERRQKALEFARQVPKPKVKREEPIETLDDFGRAQSGDKSRSSPSRRRAGEEDDVPRGGNERLLELEAQHQKDQEMIAAMKRQLGVRGDKAANRGAPAAAE